MFLAQLGRWENDNYEKRLSVMDKNPNWTDKIECFRKDFLSTNLNWKKRAEKKHEKDIIHLPYIPQKA